MPKILTNHRFLAAVILVSMAVLFGVFIYFTPPMNEDITFMAAYKSYNGGDAGFNFKAIIDFAREIRIYDNGRLCNLIPIFADNMIPRWLFAAVTGLAIAAIYWLIVLLAQIPKNRIPATLVVLWGASIFFLPWRSWMMTTPCLSNYVYPSVIVLYFLLTLSKAARKQYQSVVSIIFLAILGFLAGWSHEGFSVPLVGAVFLFAAVRKFRLPLQWWIMVLALAMGAIFVITSPGIMNRAATEMSASRAALSIYTLFALGVSMLAVLLLCVIVTFGLVYKKQFVKQSLKDSVFFISFFAAIFGAAVFLAVNSSMRAAWPAELYALIALTHFGYLLTKAKHSKLFIVAICVVYACILGFFINAIYWQKRLDTQHDKVCYLMEKSPNGTIFYDTLDPAIPSLTTLGMATVNEWCSPSMFNKLNDPDFNKNKQFAVVPSALADYTDGKGKPLVGSSGIYSYNGLLVADDSVIDFPEGKCAANGWIAFSYIDGQKHSTNAFCIRFQAKDGSFHTFIKPNLNLNTSILREMSCTFF